MNPAITRLIELRRTHPFMTRVNTDKEYHKRYDALCALASMCAKGSFAVYVQNTGKTHLRWCVCFRTDADRYAFDAAFPIVMSERGSDP